jgi:siroheme synthase
MAPCDFGVMNVPHLKRVMTEIFRGRLASGQRTSSLSTFVPSTRIAYSAISSVAVRLSSNDILRLNTPAMAFRSLGPTLSSVKRYRVPFQVVPKLSQRNTISGYISAPLTTANASPALPPPPPPTVSKARNLLYGQALTHVGKILFRK